jgi:hypothetical protein
MKKMTGEALQQKVDFTRLRYLTGFRGLAHHFQLLLRTDGSHLGRVAPDMSHAFLQGLKITVSGLFTLHRH